ncbi:MAG: DivIVA domain-containing protein [Ornithinimicrobium sp.]
MVLLILILTVLAVGVLCAVLVLRVGTPGVQDPVSTQSFSGWSPAPVSSRDVDQVRLDLAFRGYRMDQVDLVLARLSRELTERDSEIDRLRTEAGDG